MAYYPYQGRPYTTGGNSNPANDPARQRLQTYTARNPVSDYTGILGLPGRQNPYVSRRQRSRYNQLTGGVADSPMFPRHARQGAREARQQHRAPVPPGILQALEMARGRATGLPTARERIEAYRAGYNDPAQYNQPQSPGNLALPFRPDMIGTKTDPATNPLLDMPYITPQETLLKQREASGGGILGGIRERLGA